ncbi:pseudouridine synthase [Mobilicoccus pelagius]|uniref:RNA pseudouridylate synthase n=1 Tax=Mobilicoccus pelagius NBRC 104925 TaxID=1089455 RepID=H5UVC0_9MICO|nr:pseudouridine synthase [Mobilicoccus pelagius]GAB49678.1 putative pseudouridine synthase [Mobilicoccus pelagius NBRC 104925]
MREITGASEQIDRRLAAGEIVLADGAVVTATTSYVEGRRRGGSVWTYRDLPSETPVPGELVELHRDEDVLVVDKPPFLATTPRGSHVRETVLGRVQAAGDPDASPAHRLDRLTSGVLLLTLRPEARAAYQELFASRRVVKTYEARVWTAGRPAETLPGVVRSRIVKERGEMCAREVAGEPNAETCLEVLDVAGGTARLWLRPRTGRTHQLRVHLASLGTPIVGDPLYGVEADRERPESFDAPLALVARELTFVDPISGRARTFTSRCDLPGEPCGPVTGNGGGTDELGGAGTPAGPSEPDHR